MTTVNNDMTAMNGAEDSKETTVGTKQITDLFGSSEQTATGVTQLGKTAQLTSVAEVIATAVLSKISANVDVYQAKVVKSQQSHDGMDDLITECYDLSTVNIDFLKSESEEDIDKMIRSQQSKRSRSKGKKMTMDNYKTMLVGAISENLLRLAANKPKSAGGTSSRSTEIEFTEDELLKLSTDADALKKAIRNIQSKKSIMKSKADFDETSDRWLALLQTESLLINLRDNGKNAENPETLRRLEQANKVEELLNGIDDVHSLKAPEAKSTLELIKNILKGDI